MNRCNVCKKDYCPGKDGEGCCFDENFRLFKKKHPLKNFINKAEDKVKKIADKIGADAEWMAWRIPLMLLLYPAMRGYLREMKIPFQENNLPQIGTLFYHSVILGVNHFDESEHVAQVAAVAAVAVPAIMKYFSQLEKDKAEGKKLSAIQQKMLDAKDNMTAQAEQAATDQAETAATGKLRDWLFKKHGIFYVGGGLIVLVFGFTYFAGKSSGIKL